MKKRIKQSVCVLLAVILIMSTVWYVDRVLIMKRTDGITCMQNFYVQPENAVDVLILGSSHSGMNLDSEVLWSEFGISSYTLWGSVQPFWNTYHFLIEALKTQTPKVVVLDVFAATQTEEYSDPARQVTNLAGMKLSQNKWEAIQVSAPRERWTNLLLGLPIYHQRYSELTADDFAHFPWSKGVLEDKGTGFRYGTGNASLEDVSRIEEAWPLLPKQEEYLRKIIDLCREKAIPLVLVTTPTAYRSAEQPYYNTVEDIAREQGVTYYNFNLMDDATGFSAACFWTDNNHLNTEGARLITRYLGSVLAETISLEDHRGDPKYSSWESNARLTQNGYLAQITDVQDYLEELKRNGRTAYLIGTDTTVSLGAETDLAAMLQWAAVTENASEYSAGMWHVADTAAGVAADSCAKGFPPCHGKTAEVENGGFYLAGKWTVSADRPGVVCIICDPETGTCVDVVTFLEEDGFALKHAQRPA